MGKWSYPFVQAWVVEDFKYSSFIHGSYIFAFVRTVNRIHVDPIGLLWPDSFSCNKQISMFLSGWVQDKISDCKMRKPCTGQPYGHVHVSQEWSLHEEAEGFSVASSTVTTSGGRGGGGGGLAVTNQAHSKN
jgi:hypothetical protein